MTVYIVIVDYGDYPMIQAVYLSEARASQHVDRLTAENPVPNIYYTSQDIED